MPDLGRTLVVLGLGIVAIGVILLLAPKVAWLGRLPGDLRIQRDGLTVHVPLGTCLVVSVVLTILANLFLRR